MQAQHRIMTKEATQSYAKERARAAHLFSPIMQGVMVEGDAVTARQYADAKKRRRRALAELDEAWTRFDLLLAPSARGEALSGLSNTGAIQIRGSASTQATLDITAAAGIVREKPIEYSWSASAGRSPSDSGSALVMSRRKCRLTPLNSTDTASRLVSTL